MKIIDKNESLKLKYDFFWGINNLSNLWNSKKQFGVSLLGHRVEDQYYIQGLESCRWYIKLCSILPNYSYTSVCLHLTNYIKHIVFHSHTKHYSYYHSVKNS